MKDEFLQTCREEMGEITTEIAMLGDGQIIANNEYDRVMRMRRPRRVLSRLSGLVEELKTAEKPQLARTAVGIRMVPAANDRVRP
jgi:hypothetical protein